MTLRTQQRVWDHKTFPYSVYFILYYKLKSPDPFRIGAFGNNSTGILILMPRQDQGVRFTVTLFAVIIETLQHRF
jgi:hypothetical protein